MIDYPIIPDVTPEELEKMLEECEKENAALTEWPEVK